MRDPAKARRPGPGLIVTLTCLLALLYFGRDVLQPLALAAILSLAIAPFVRALRRLGMRRVPATVGAVLVAGTCLVGVGTVLGFQLVAVAGDLPKYRAAIRGKIAQVRELTERPFARIEAELSAVATPGRAAAPPKTGADRLAASQVQPIPVEVRAPRVTTRDALARVFGMIWGPVGQAGLVLVLLVFILLEHESLMDRLIRVAGQNETRRTIKALADATRGVSRFFFTQFVVNTAFGLLLGLMLFAAGVPHAILWGALAGLLRFVPYVGVMVAGAMIALFIAAIDPGWQLAVYCIGLFLVLELIVAHVVEPKVYGHSAGLSPLAVIVSALFWGAMWGPVGLLLSTPLTLCLVVAGRHLRGLGIVTTLLGDAPSVTASQRLYQRLLIGDTDAIIQDGRSYLRNYSFARYCDHILLPGLALAAADNRSGHIDKAQEMSIRAAIALIAATLTPVSGAPARRGRRHVSLLDTSVGAHLRQMREERLGRWQGSLDVPSRSIVLCAGLGTERDDLLSELLVRSLREVGVDARSISLAEGAENPGLDKAFLVSTAFMIYPGADSIGAWLEAAASLREGLPDAHLVSIRLPFDELDAGADAVEERMDMILRSFEEGLAFVAPENPAAS
ncbi:AI-2E family transporter [Massilia sp. PAMC28688]|uniref:AI-2E family transporter n=1 Tax=Massilia sp. PAMC28688 TaxID=2861283 RepID=UPI001C62CFB6|nr:AI-2E family transporter [Massilia sp. PAMC28688]QYF93439.1 AI-2E family transporter [Massilia sp. PAMC28688]